MDGGEGTRREGRAQFFGDGEEFAQASLKYPNPGSMPRATKEAFDNFSSSFFYLLRKQQIARPLYHSWYTLSRG
ncbi:MAG: hypothetical protein QW260_06155 [Thermoproteota archaeon]